MEKENTEKQNSQKRSPLNSYVKYSGMAFQMIATILLGLWAGTKLDDYFQVKSHLFTIFLLLFSVVASIYFVVRGLLK